jgi:hypothetical protein
MGRTIGESRETEPVFPVGQTGLFALVTALFFLWGMVEQPHRHSGAAVPEVI